MTIDRREFLAELGLVLSAGTAGLSCRTGTADAGPSRLSQRQLTSPASAVTTQGAWDGSSWSDVREQFDISDDFVHMSALFIASHPRQVREAIERHRRELDRNPVPYLQERNGPLRDEARRAAARYLGGRAGNIALTESTTMGLGLVYNGLRLRPGQEILSTEHEYYVTHESLRLAAARTGAASRQIPLYSRIAELSADQMVQRLRREIRPATRVLALTWVSSGTGVKLPLAEIGRMVRDVNAARDSSDRVLLCVDGVHGFGVEDERATDLGCDFFIAGCHKWLFGPRGTGLIWGRLGAWPALRATIPSFIDDDSWLAWMSEGDPSGPTTANRIAPGGFKAFEHQWALTPAFEFHRRIGKSRIATRTHQLATQLKEGLERIPRVRVITPRSPELSSGIVCCQVEGKKPEAVVQRLRERKVVATTTPYAIRYVRFAPSIRNTAEEVEVVLREMRRVA